MPYVDKTARERVALAGPSTPGELNYAITIVCKNYLERQSATGVTYTTLNQIVGAMECAKQEFIRRVVNPYEDKKIKENGDVY